MPESTCIRPAGDAAQRDSANTTMVATSISSIQLPRTKSLTFSTTRVRNGSASPMASKICRNCGTTKASRMMTDSTATPAKMMG